MSNFEPFPGMWRRIEQRAIVITLLAYVILNWTLVFVPQLRTYVSGNTSLAIFATLLLAVFRLFEQRLTRTAIESYGPSLGAAIDAALGKRSYFSLVDLWAHSSTKYLAILSNSEVRIKHMRILIAAIDLNTAGPSILGNQQYKEIHRQERDTAIRQWQRLADKGIIEKLEIREYTFVSQYHFIVFDGKVAVFGLFRFPAEASETRVKANFTAHRHDPVGSDLISDLASLFESVFKNQSQPVSLPASADAGAAKDAP